VTTSLDYEATGPNYAVDKLLDVRERVHQAIAAVSAKIAPGMVEEDAVAMARATLGDMGMRKGWHRVIVRFGPNTTKDFMADSEPGVVLGSDDIFFLDIGPVYGDTEGDAGQTFVFGDDPEHHKAARDVRALWDDVREQWFARGLTGRGARPGARLGTQPRPVRPPPRGLPARGPLRRLPRRRRHQAQPQPMGPRDGDQAPHPPVRRVLRGPAARGPVVRQLTVAVTAEDTGCLPRCTSTR
jgi:hypothetical protein